MINNFILKSLKSVVNDFSLTYSKCESRQKQGLNWVSF